MYACFLQPKTCKFVSTTEKRTLYICDDNCLSSFQEENAGKVTTALMGDLRVKNLAPEPEINDSSTKKVTFMRKCIGCGKKVQSSEYSLSWETMDFCNELCLCKLLNCVFFCMQTLFGLYRMAQFLPLKLLCTVGSDLFKTKL